MTTTFDADGETLTVTDALNRTTTYTYSVRGWVRRRPIPWATSRPMSTRRPASGGCPGAIGSGGGQIQVSGYTYDADGRRDRSKDGLSEFTTYAYDGVGNQIERGGGEWDHNDVCL